MQLRAAAAAGLPTSAMMSGFLWLSPEDVSSFVVRSNVVAKSPLSLQALGQIFAHTTEILLNIMRGSACCSNNAC